MTTTAPKNGKKVFLYALYIIFTLVVYVGSVSIFFLVVKMMQEYNKIGGVRNLFEAIILIIAIIILVVGHVYIRGALGKYLYQKGVKEKAGA